MVGARRVMAMILVILLSPLRGMAEREIAEKEIAGRALLISPRRLGGLRVYSLFV